MVPYSGRHLNAYPEALVPHDAELPYLTYTLTRSDFLTDTIGTIRVWSRSTNLTQLFGFLDYVDKAIPFQGVRLSIPDENGELIIYRGTPFVQRQPTDESDIQVGYVNLQIRNHYL